MKVKIYSRPKQPKVYSEVAIQRQALKVLKLGRHYNEVYQTFMRENARLSDMRNSRRKLDLDLISPREPGTTGRRY